MKLYYSFWNHSPLLLKICAKDTMCVHIIKINKREKAYRLIADSSLKFQRVLPSSAYIEEIIVEEIIVF